MHHAGKIAGILGIALGLVGAVLGGDDAGQASGDTTDTWHIRATGARIVGGYGDNFAYDGENVRRLTGHADVTLDPDAGTGRIDITVRTTAQSGPVRFSRDRSWEGEIHIVQQLDLSRMELARIEQQVWLHGDTGNEAPVMPALFNYFATWGPSRIELNGREVVPMIGSHSMLSERARGEDGRIVNGRNQVYSPMTADKSGFTDPSDVEFHFVAHTTEPDPGNFPPHSAWIHLQFGDVEVLQKPSGVTIPYSGR